MKGNNDEKFAVLNALAKTDYKSAERIHYSELCEVTYSNMTTKGYTHLSVINSVFENDFEFFAQEAEKLLPLKFKFIGDGKGENKTIKQTLPKSPLYVLTTLMENEYGDMRPHTTDENKYWIQCEKNRLNVI